MVGVIQFVRGAVEELGDEKQGMLVFAVRDPFGKSIQQLGHLPNVAYRLTDEGVVSERVAYYVVP